MAPPRPPARTAALLLAAALLPLAACDRDPPDDALGHPRAHAVARIASPEEALGNAVLAHLDLATMNDAEIRPALGPGRQCRFRYTSTGRPVLAAGTPAQGGGTGGIVKLNGHLVPLSADPAADPPGAAPLLRLAAGPLRLSVDPAPLPGEDRDEALREADLVFEVADRLKVGYRGYLACATVR